MSDLKEKSEKCFKRLIESANAGSPLDLFMTFLRVRGIENEEDPFISAKNKIEKIIQSDYKDEKIGDILNCEDFFFVLVNLLRVSNKQSYNPYPFKGSSHQPKEYLVELAENIKEKELVELIKQLDLESDFKARSINSISVLGTFIDIYQNHLKKFKKPQYFYLGNFEVLETICDEVNGLKGIKIHFSNGADAEYTRNERGTMAINIYFEIIDGEANVSFMAGNLNELKNKWMIGEEEAWKVAPNFGRYNQFGYWQPLFYPPKLAKHPGGFEEYEDRVKAMEIDQDVKNVLFTIMCTGHWNIEFAVKGNFTIEKNVLNFNDHLDLYKSETFQETATSSIVVYDGNLALESLEPKYIEESLNYIGKYPLY